MGHRDCSSVVDDIPALRFALRASRTDDTSPISLQARIVPLSCSWQQDNGG